MATPQQILRVPLRGDPEGELGYLGTVSLADFE